MMLGMAADHTFTLKEVVVAGHAGTPDVTAVYWGYNPHNDHDTVDGNGNPVSGVPADGGIPVADLISFLTTITGLDLHELGLIDAHVIPVMDKSMVRAGTPEPDDSATGNSMVVVTSPRL